MRVFEPEYLKAMGLLSDNYVLAAIRPDLKSIILPGHVSAADFVEKRFQDASNYESKWSQLVETTGARIAQDTQVRADLEKKSDQSDMVHAPAHYTQGTMQVIEAMQALMTPEEFRGHLKGCVFKYLFRYRYKGQKEQDLQKILTYSTWLKQFETDGHITILPAKEKS